MFALLFLPRISKHGQMFFLPLRPKTRNGIYHVRPFFLSQPTIRIKYVRSPASFQNLVTLHDMSSSFLNSALKISMSGLPLSKPYLDFWMIALFFPKSKRPDCMFSCLCTSKIWSATVACLPFFLSERGNKVCDVWIFLSVSRDDMSSSFPNFALKVAMSGLARLF
jgi:hypothetical protein